MPSPAALRAARAALQVSLVGTDLLLSIAGSGVGCGIYVGRSFAEDARGALVHALGTHFHAFIRRAGYSSPSGWAPWVAIVVVEQLDAHYSVRLCGQELPGPETPPAHDLRLALITHSLACALDQALGELVSRKLFSELEAA